ncbi:SRPBCC family protein [Streptomyces sp. NPDC002306]
MSMQVDTTSATTVLATLHGTVDNTVERVFDFVSVDDVVLAILTGPTALTNYEIINGPWGRVGASRWLNFQSGLRAQETIDALVRPHLYAYHLTQFSGDVGTLTDLASSQWIFTPVGTRTQIEWTYSWRALNSHSLDELQRFVSQTWLEWMTSTFKETQRLLKRDILGP